MTLSPIAQFVIVYAVGFIGMFITMASIMHNRDKQDKR